MLNLIGGDRMHSEIICHQLGKDPLYKTWHTSPEHLIMYFYSDGGSVVCAEDVFPIKKGSLILLIFQLILYLLY